jgi:hypothetical protein
MKEYPFRARNAEYVKPDCEQHADIPRRMRKEKLISAFCAKHKSTLLDSAYPLTTGDEVALPY